MNPVEPETVVDYADHLGENPLWHAAEGRLYWEDYTRGRLLRYDPDTGAHEVFYEGRRVGGFTVQADGSLLLFMEQGAVAIWRDGEVSYVIDEVPGVGDGHFNDVIADPAGRVFCGSLPAVIDESDWEGRLYRLDTDGTITPVVEGVGCSNGMGFTPDGRGMYYTDSLARNIYLFDYDVESGELSNQRVFVETPEGEGFGPDGMTVDAEGCVWSAIWDASSLVRYTPDGVEERRFRFPAKKVSSVTFGGGDYTDLYVTSAGGDDRAAEGDGAGALFRLSPGVQGVPEFRSRVGI